MSIGGMPTFSDTAILPRWASGSLHLQAKIGQEEPEALAAVAGA